MIKSRSPSAKEIYPHLRGMVNYPIQNNSIKKNVLAKPIQIQKPLIICGPSGTGKTTLVKRLMEEFNDLFGFSISHTTRSPRAGEKDGKDYYFVSRNRMELYIQNGYFIETAEFSGNLYGTSKRAIRDVQKLGRICILDVEVEGVRRLKNTELNPKCIFIQPPSLNVLEQRLRNRGTETEQSLKKRLDRATIEINLGQCPGIWDYSIINDDLDEAYNELKKFILENYKL